MVGRRYVWNEDWLIFGSVANGTKSGTIETVTGETLPSNGLVSCVGAPAPSDPDRSPVVNADEYCAAIPVDKEEITTYEIGTRSARASLTKVNGIVWAPPTIDVLSACFSIVMMI